MTHRTASKRFEELFIWQEAIKLAKDVFVLFEGCTLYSLKDQIERAVISISSNIAEGYELDTNRQFVRYLYIAKGSCGEVRSQLLLAREIGLFKDVTIEPMVQTCSRLSVMIHKLIKERQRFQGATLSRKPT